jgi:hypothetical protein
MEGKMGLEHEFYLVEDKIDLNEVWMLRENKNKVIESVAFHDDIIQYILDTLKWIPSKNPAYQGNTNGKGINYYGVTLFDKQSSESLKGVFTSWRDLFKNAPGTFELTGSFVWEDNEQDGVYERSNINLDQVVTQLEKIIFMSDQLAKGDFYLYHFGI